MSQDHSVRSRVRAFLTERHLEVDDDLDLFESGLVNSLFAMQLVLFVESTFGFRVANDDLDIQNFRSINAIVALIERKQRAPKEGAPCLA